MNFGCVQKGNSIESEALFMQMYVISDNVDTCTGMRLAGIDGIVIHEREALKEEFDELLKNKDIGIILITEKLSHDFSDIVNSIKLSCQTPLIVEIPDRHGTGRKADFITAYVNEAIGLKL